MTTMEEAPSVVLEPDAQEPLPPSSSSTAPSSTTTTASSTIPIQPAPSSTPLKPVQWAEGTSTAVSIAWGSAVLASGFIGLLSLVFGLFLAAGVVLVSTAAATLIMKSVLQNRKSHGMDWTSRWELPGNVGVPMVGHALTPLVLLFPSVLVSWLVIPTSTDVPVGAVVVLGYAVSMHRLVKQRFQFFVPHVQYTQGERRFLVTGPVVTAAFALLDFWTASLPSSSLSAVILFGLSATVKSATASFALWMTVYRITAPQLGVAVAASDILGGAGLMLLWMNNGAMSASALYAAVVIRAASIAGSGIWMWKWPTPDSIISPNEDGDLPTWALPILSCLAAVRWAMFGVITGSWLMAALLMTWPLPAGILSLVRPSIIPTNRIVHWARVCVAVEGLALIAMGQSNGCSYDCALTMGLAHVVAVVPVFLTVLHFSLVYERLSITLVFMVTAGSGQVASGMLSTAWVLAESPWLALVWAAITVGYMLDMSALVSKTFKSGSSDGWHLMILPTIGMLFAQCLVLGIAIPEGDAARLSAASMQLGWAALTVLPAGGLFLRHMKDHELASCLRAHNMTARSAMEGHRAGTTAPWDTRLTLSSSRASLHARQETGPGLGGATVDLEEQSELATVVSPGVAAHLDPDWSPWAATEPDDGPDPDQVCREIMAFSPTFVAREQPCSQETHEMRN